MKRRPRLRDVHDVEQLLEQRDWFTSRRVHLQRGKRWRWIPLGDSTADDLAQEVQRLKSDAVHWRDLAAQEERRAAVLERLQSKLAAASPADVLAEAQPRPRPRLRLLRGDDSAACPDSGGAA